MDEEAALALVRRMYAAFAAADIGVILELADPAIEVIQAEELPWGGHHRGHDGFGAFMLGLIGSIESTVTHHELFAAGDRVVQVGRTAGTVKSNGAPFDIPEVHVWTLRDGRVVRFEAYIDTPAMLAALAV